MRTPSFAPFAALLVPALVFTAVFAHRPSPPVSPDPEVQRLRRHFGTVERELLERDVSHLTSAQRAARARHIVRLRTYARTGVFPKNTEFPGRRVPYFIDRFGTRCAMAYLIEEAGHGVYVQRVADRMNNAYIAQIARDPKLGAPLLAWLEENGLTMEEAARIQPEYCWLYPPCPGDEPDPGPARPSVGYKIGSGAALASGLSTLALNASLVDLGLSRRTRGWLGVSAGALGLALAASALDEGDGYKTWSIVNGSVGALAMVFGLNAALRGSPPQVASSGKEATPNVRAGPWVSPGGSVGAQLSVTF